MHGACGVGVCCSRSRHAFPGAGLASCHTAWKQDAQRRIRCFDTSRCGMERYDRDKRGGFAQLTAAVPSALWR